MLLDHGSSPLHHLLQLILKRLNLKYVAHYESSSHLYLGVGLLRQTQLITLYLWRMVLLRRRMDISSLSLLQGFHRSTQQLREQQLWHVLLPSYTRYPTSFESLYNGSSHPLQRKFLQSPHASCLKSTLALYILQRNARLLLRLR